MHKLDRELIVAGFNALPISRPQQNSVKVSATIFAFIF